MSQWPYFEAPQLTIFGNLCVAYIFYVSFLILAVTVILYEYVTHSLQRLGELFGGEGV